MTKEWYEDTILDKTIPNFKPTNVKFITDFHYYIDYNSYYEKVSLLEMGFLVEADNKKFILKIKFYDVSSLDLIGFGNNYNQLMGFKINNLSNSGYEKRKKYFVEDYENKIIKFYCAGLEILSLVELKKSN
ncbi:hypothetical protein EDD68_1342 [Melghiribacillus thermohalophilus]|uniref:Immunity protein 50 of polymorphic toxin system n=1 Tax=Melghiribacillus thermohalophilus TaxID=1324956 RepID=A0A4R3MN63_9BACI|nr:hypothetical protein [Melghiribacillus thermohalophilus]TCT16439.1 hypothetical protein EDD68_1342 [Melghiribacillus thermohalophilus]